MMVQNHDFMEKRQKLSQNYGQNPVFRYKMSNVHLWECLHNYSSVKIHL